MAKRYVIVQKQPELNPKPFYEDETQAIEAFRTLQKSVPNPDSFELVMIDEDQNRAIPLVVTEQPATTAMTEPPTVPPTLVQ